MDNLEIGDRVKRTSKYQDIGTVVEFDYALEKVRVSWGTKRTWCKATEIKKICLG